MKEISPQKKWPIPLKKVNDKKIIIRNKKKTEKHFREYLYQISFLVEDI